MTWVTIFRKSDPLRVKVRRRRIEGVDDEVLEVRTTVRHPLVSTVRLRSGEFTSYHRAAVIKAQKHRLEAELDAALRAALE